MTAYLRAPDTFLLVSAVAMTKHRHNEVSLHPFGLLTVPGDRHTGKPRFID